MSAFKAIAFLFFLTLSIQGKTQENPKADSILALLPSQKDTALVKSYDQLFRYTFRKNPDLAKSYLDSAYLYFEGIENERILANLTLAKGIYLDRIAKFKEALPLYKEALQLFTNIGDQKNMSFCLNTIAAIYQTKGDYYAALDHYLQSLEIKEKLSDNDVELLISYSNIGVVHKKIGNVPLALEYYKKAEAIAIEQNKGRALASIRGNMGNIYTNEKNYALAEEYYLKSLPYFEENKLNYTLVLQYTAMGDLYTKMGAMDRAKKYLYKALEIHDTEGEKLHLGNTLIQLGDFHFKTKEYNTALKNYTRAQQVFYEDDVTSSVADSYLKLALTQAELGNYKSAYENSRQHFIYHDSILGAENLKKINELEIQYQTEKKEQQLVLQEKEIQLLESEAEVSSLQKRSLVGGLALSILSILLGFYSYQQRMKRHQVEKDKMEADLEFKSKELTTQALLLSRKNETLKELKQKAEQLQSNENQSNGYQKLINSIDLDLNNDESWNRFAQHFEEVHTHFYQNATSQYPGLTPGDLRLMTLLRMNISSKEIASILNISSNGIKKARQRLRRKMNLNANESLEQAIFKI